MTDPRENHGWRSNIVTRFDSDFPRVIWCDDGWERLIVGLVAGLDALKAPYKIQRIKEKYGGLRFYAEPIGGGDDVRRKFYELVDEACDKSLSTCEGCGEKGDTHNRGRITTRCETCFETLSQER